MNYKQIIPFAFSGMLIYQTAQAQLFETRSTRYGGNAILDSLNKTDNKIQLAIRDSLMNHFADKLQVNEKMETFFDGYHMGLIIYKDMKPYELIGFWDPKGKTVFGGKLSKGNGEIQTPFNRSMVKNFSNESVIYENGVKNGAVFYFCDCAKVLRKGTFKNNAKEGWWKEFTPNGNFVQQKYIKPVEEIKVIEDDNKWLEPAHCMMRNPNEDIKCPQL